MSFADYIDNLVKYGKSCFSLDQCENAMGKTRKAIRSSIEHFMAKGKVAAPAKGFYVIIPPEYHKLGCIPAEQFIPYLMEYWKCPYYAGLLTAAAYHGASHQSVHVFQVMVASPKPSIACGSVKVRFITKKHICDTETQIRTTPRSMLTISTPESTAMDLVNYIQQSGGLSHVATVLAELQEVMQLEKIIQLIAVHPQIAWKQRLGYLLEFVGAQELAKAVKDYLSKQKRIDYIPLLPGEAFNKGNKNKNWKIIENTTIEIDI